MAQVQDKIDVYLEIGKKSIISGAVEWPGWVRWAKDEPSALQQLCDYGPRYQRLARGAHLEFERPTDPSAFAVVERMEGSAATDLGVPTRAPSADERPVEDADLARFQAILAACWRTFDKAMRSAEGKELARGPRGGGRSQDAIAKHVSGADEAYARSVGWVPPKGGAEGVGKDLRATRKMVLTVLQAAVRGEYPERGPRGGRRWNARYFVRRVAYHVLDHTWEIEDRVT